MKDYRTWWRKEGMGFIHLFGFKTWHGNRLGYFSGDNNTRDCIAEQIWAEDFGLADSPREV